MGVRLMLVRGRGYRAYCSESCLRDDVRRLRNARVAARRRASVAAFVIGSLLVGGILWWQRHYAAPQEVIVSGPPEKIRPKAAPPGPVYFGPAWPPTDAEWISLFTGSSWIYPLPGPVRRALRTDSRIFGPEAPANHPALCRQEKTCGVDLGGELWGEHVYAVHDGVVDRVQAVGGDERGGQYVRLSHFGGMVFTQYFHLAAIPRGVSRGARIRAGEIIGLLGDTGIKGSRRHLHFTLSIHPSIAFSEVYWDPRPWMANCPLRLPLHGTVAGLAADDRETEMPRRHHSR